MIRVRCITGPFAGRVREMTTSIEPAELFSSFMEHGWEWEVDYSQASGVEAVRWGRADLCVRAVRAMRKGLPVSFMGNVYTDPVELEDAIVYSGKSVSLGRDNDSGVEITAYDLSQPEPLATLRRAQEWIEVHSQELLEAGKPVPSWQKKNAFARAAAYLVSRLPLGTAGGPTVREHAALRQFGQVELTFEEAVEILSREDDLMFGSLTDLHRRCWLEASCHEDDPEDVAELIASTGYEPA